MKNKLFFITLLFSCFYSFGQIYQDNFGTTAITVNPYTNAPTISDANLNSFSWLSSSAIYAGFAGNGGAPSQSLSLNNSSGTPTLTLTFNVAAGFQMSVTQFDFWRVRSAAGAQNWNLTINGIAVGSGTVPTTGALLGATNVSNPVTNLTGTINVVLTLSGATGAGTFRLDDFTLIGSVTSACLSPTVQATTPTTSLVTSNSGTVGWTRGNGTSVLVVARAGSAVNADPTSGTSYIASAVFGTGTQIGTGNFVVYNGTGTSVNVTNLLGSTTYHFAIYEYFTATNCYNLTQLVTNFTTPSAPITITLSNNGTQIAANNVPQATVNHILHQSQLAVANGASTLNGITGVVTTGTYIATDVVNLKVRYSTDAILDVGDATLSTITNPGIAGSKAFSIFSPQTIPTNTTGYIFITADISATATSGNTIGLNAVTPANFLFSAGTISGSTTNGGLQTITVPAPNVPTSFGRTCLSNNSVSLTWLPPTTGSIDGYILVVREAAVPNAVTSIHAATQPFNLNYTLAPTYNATTSRVLYIGSATSAVVTGLTQGVSYTFALHSYRNSGPSASVYSVATTTTQIINLSNVTGFGSTPANASGTITWTNPTTGCFDEILAVVTLASGITFAPTGNGSAYIANNVYTAPNQVVFNSNGNFVNVTGLTNGTTYYVEIFVRSGTQWSSGVEVSVTPNASTIFKPGELMFVGFDGQVFSTGAADQYMVATMVDILPGTTFSIANSRYEAGAAANVRTDKWGGPGNNPEVAPGVTNITYNGTTNISAGSILVMNTNSTTNLFDYFGVISGTTLTDRTVEFSTTQPFGLGTAPNITTASGDGEQIWLLQGNFVSDGFIDLNEANYLLFGTLLHGFTIKVSWIPLTSACSGATTGGSTRQSRLPNSLTCFNVESAVSNTISGYYINSAEHGSTTLRNIIRAIGNVGTNWVIATGRYTIDATSSANNRAGKTFIIGTGETSGQWVGDIDTNWFNCSNWGRLTVPDETIDVVVDATISQRNAVIDATATFSDFYTDLALCNNLVVTGRSVVIEGNNNNRLQVFKNISISSTGLIDMNDGNNATADGQINLLGDWTNNVGLNAFDEGNGTVNFIGSIPQVINNNNHSNTEEFFNVVLDNDFSTTSSNNLFAKGNLEVKANKNVVVASNDFVQVDKNFTNLGSFEINNNGILLQTDDSGVNNGNIVVRRNASVRLQDYVFWSSPIEQFNVSNISPATPSSVIWRWNPKILNQNGLFGNWENTPTVNMDKGRGYIVRGPSGISNSTPSTIITTFQNAGSNLGKPNNGIITQRLFRGPIQSFNLGSFTSSNGATFSEINDNMNLVGNPYPSAISVSSFLNYNALTTGPNPVIEGSVRIWSHNTLPVSPNSPFYNSYQYNYTNADYIVYNGTATIEGPTGFNGFIGTGQGFFVVMNDGPITNDGDAPINLIFNNAMRVKSTNSNSQFYRSANQTTSTQDDKHRIWLDLVNSVGSAVRTVVGYVPNATLEKDVMYDAFVEIDGSQNIYSVIDNHKVCIQGRPLPFENSDMVPMGICIPTTGSYTIAIAYLDGLFTDASQEIYLEDKLLNVIHNLKQSPYTFTSNTGLFNSRFVLRYNNQTLTNPDFENNQTIKIATKNQTIDIISSIENILDVQIFDIVGREIKKVKQIDNKEVSISNINASNQALIVKIKLSNGDVVTRKIIL